MVLLHSNVTVSQHAQYAESEATKWNSIISHIIYTRVLPTVTFQNVFDEMTHEKCHPF